AISSALKRLSPFVSMKSKLDFNDGHRSSSLASRKPSWLVSYSAMICLATSSGEGYFGGVNASPPMQPGSRPAARPTRSKDGQRLHNLPRPKQLLSFWSFGMAQPPGVLRKPEP